jgi:hypothetical protein
MQVTIHVHRVEITCPSVTLDDLQALESKLMSVITDKIAALTTSVDGALARVQEDVTTLQAKIDALQAQVDAGVATPEDLAALDALQAKVDALDPVKPDVLPEPPQPTP